MNPKFAAVKNHFTNWREWELNPIVIKELRQAVRSWAVTGMLLLFLTVLFITSLVFLVGQSFNVHENTELGGTMFQAFAVILAGASILFIPLYIGVRVGAERVESNTDLLYVSTLSPGRIIRGKLLCGAYMALLFFSACMPFMAFTNLLRGVDLPSVFFILFFLFLVVCAANQIAIFLACLPLSRPFKVLLALAGFFFSFWIIGGMIAMTFQMMRSGVGAMMSDRNFWIAIGTALGAGVALVGLFYVLSVALISPPSANRARQPRRYLTLVWLLGGALTIIWIFQVAQPELILVWTYATFFLMVFALLVTISNADELSPRVRRDIPAGGLRRLLAFPFFNGAAGGLVWVAGLTGLTFLLSELILTHARDWFSASFSLSSTDQEKIWLYNSTLIAYAFAYALTALFIHRQFMPRRQPKIAGLLIVLLAGLWAIVPGIVLFFLNKLSWKSVESLQLGNMFNIFSLQEDGQRIYHLYFATGWLVLVLALNAPWFLRQWRNFQPLPARVPPPLAETTPVP